MTTDEAAWVAAMVVVESATSVNEIRLHQVSLLWLELVSTAKPRLVSSLKMSRSVRNFILTKFETIR